MTAATIEASTGPQIRNRAPVVNATSITPASIGTAVIGAASVGTSTVNDANRRAPCNCRRQRNSWLACIPASRATVDATAPGSIAAATMRSFSALDHLRRCRTEVTISAWVSVIGSPPQYPLSEPADDFGTNWGELLHKRSKQGLNVSIVFEVPHPLPSPLTNGGRSPLRSRRHLQVIARSHVFAQTTPRLKLRLSPYSCFALVLYQPKFPERIRGPSVPL